MSDLNIKEIKIEEAKFRNFNDFEISLKRDGTLIYFVDKFLLSSRKVNRSDRFKQILEILEKSDFPNCYGEMYIEGGKVFDVSSKKNWGNVKFMPIDLFNSTLKYSERQKIITEKIKETNNELITEKIRFSNIDEGWNYVLKNNEEGLILKNDYEWYKIKVLCEAKIKIKEWERGEDKGTFILENGNRISGTSKGYVEIFLQALKENKEAIAEIEYPYLTEEGHYFQPRLRRIEVVK
jgi:hypothetical protein